MIRFFAITDFRDEKTKFLQHNINPFPSQRVLILVFFFSNSRFIDVIVFNGHLVIHTTIKT